MARTASATVASELERLASLLASMYNQALKYRLLNEFSPHRCLSIAEELIRDIDSGRISFTLKSHGNCAVTCTHPAAWKLLEERALEMAQDGKIKIKFPNYDA